MSRSVAALCAGAALGACGSARAQQVIWEDDFSGASLDASKWAVSTNDNFIHRTRFGEAPQVLAEGATTFARMRLQTHNPNASDKTLGTEMWSRPEWNVGTGLEWEARIRGTQLPKGICHAFFSYRRRDFGFDRDQEEIDFEFLSNWINASDPYIRRSVWTNVWNSGIDSGTSRPATTLDQTQWHTYTIRWLPNQVVWLVDGEVLRTESTLVPDDQMAICFNIWAPDSTWATAYDSALAPTNAAANRTSFFDLDYVRVRRLAPPSGQGSIGSGEGLTAVYYNAATQSGGAPVFSDERFSAFARRFNFTPSVWGTSPFDGRLGNDNWGAVFKGELQAQFSEATTFSAEVQSSDGVRLFLGNQLVLSKSPSSGADSTVEVTGTASLVAGTRYPIRIEFWDGTGSASLRLLWSSASLPKQLVSSSQLYPAMLPAPTLSPPPSTYTASQRVVAASAEPGAGIRYTTDGSEPQYGSPIFPSGGLDVSTSTTLRLKSWKDGYWASIVSGGAYYVDSVAPVVALLAPVGGQIYTSLAQASGAATDAGSSGLDRVLVRLSRASDGAFWNATTSTWGAQASNAATINGGVWSFAMPALAEGSYTLRAQAFDRAGNASTEASASFFVDSTAPALAIDAPSADGFVPTAPSSASGRATDAGTGVASISARLQRTSDGVFWNGGAWAAAPADLPVSYAAPAWSLALPGLGEGRYTLTLAASDGAGNTSSLARSFGVDNGAPTVSIGGPAEGAVLRGGFVLNGSAADSGSGVASVGVRVQRLADGAFWNGSAWGADTELAARALPNGSGGVDWTLGLPLFADGAYAAFVAARVAAGDAAPASVRWRFDATAPGIAVSEPASGATASTWGAPRGPVSDGDSGSGVASVAVALRQGDAFWNGAGWVYGAISFPAAVENGAWAWPSSVALPPSANGFYAVEATATDAAGNASTARSAFTLAVPTVPTPTAPPAPTPTPAPPATPVPTEAPDRTPPVVSVASPPHNSVWRTMPILRGLATDNARVASVEVTLMRHSDRRYWNGSAWAASATLSPTVAGGIWVWARIPTGAALPAGLYTVTALATDSSGLRARAVSVIRIDQRAPDITFVRPSEAPSQSTIWAPPPQIVVRALDDAAGTRLTEVMLWRRSDGRYWNGRAWAAGLVALPLSPINPTRTERPSAVVWQNGFALPPAAQWQPGEYALVVRALDWAANASNKRLELTLAVPSPFVASSIRAEASPPTASVAFTGPLDARSAQSPANFKATVNGVARSISAARYSAATRAVSLSLAGAVPPGARVQIWWSGLRDPNGRTLRDATAATTVPATSTR